MWLLTTEGFVSIVKDRKDDRMVYVRARNRQHLVAFRQFLHPKTGRITHDKTHDYPYRLHVSQVRAAQAVFDMMIEMDYDNFKEAAAKRHGKVSEYVMVLFEVYSSLVGLEDRDARKQAEKAIARLDISR